MSENEPAPERVVKYIHRYLPTIYTDKTIVNFECGCWYGSERESFCYDCPTHKEQSRS